MPACPRDGVVQVEQRGIHDPRIEAGSGGPFRAADPCMRSGELAPRGSRREQRRVHVHVVVLRSEDECAREHPIDRRAPEDAVGVGSSAGIRKTWAVRRCRRSPCGCGRRPGGGRRPGPRRTSRPPCPRVHGDAGGSGRVWVTRGRPLGRPGQRGRVRTSACGGGQREGECRKGEEEEHRGEAAIRSGHLASLPSTEGGSLRDGRATDRGRRVQSAQRPARNASTSAAAVTGSGTSATRTTCGPTTSKCSRTSSGRNRDRWE